MHELCSKGAVELAGMIASRRVLAGDVVDAYLARIEAVNPSLNAITVTLADTARAAAAEVDRAIAAGKKLGPLAACRSPSRRTSTSPARPRPGALRR